jgi:hypothetical protein
MARLWRPFAYECILAIKYISSSKTAIVRRNMTCTPTPTPTHFSNGMVKRECVYLPKSPGRIATEE